MATSAAIKANMPTLRARAPAKAILTGEHAVVYGAEALAVALGKYTQVEFQAISHSPVINTLFSGISMGASYPLHALSRLKDKLDARFEAFSAGDLPVQRILSRPDDLLIYTLCTISQHLPSRGTIKGFLPKAGRLVSHSNIPAGAGMGSSAAAIAATIVLYEHIANQPLDVEQRFELVKFCERLQHGKGSAIDAATVVFGGAVRLAAGRVENTAFLPQNWYWLYSGSPASSTGECVAHVRRHFGSDALLWDEFASVVQELSAAMTQNRACGDLIRANQQFLQRIGVVPAATSALITAIERAGGSAKISGAGAVSGSGGGLVLAYMPDAAPLHKIATEFAVLEYGALNIDHHGAQFLGEQHDL